MRHLTEEQKAKTEQRKAHLKDIIKAIAAMSEDQKAQVAERMGRVINTEGHPFTLHNTLMIAAQGAQNVTVVGGFKQWLKQGRAVKRGEHGYAILFPREKKNENQDKPATEENDNPEIHFLIGYVFDISQTLEIQTN